MYIRTFLHYPSVTEAIRNSFSISLFFSNTFPYPSGYYHVLQASVQYSLYVINACPSVLALYGASVNYSGNSSGP